MLSNVQQEACQGIVPRAVAWAAALLLLTGAARLCNVQAKPRVHGLVAGQQVSAVADSPCVAKFVENQHDDAMRSALDNADARPLDAQTLQELAQAYSADLATLYFVERLYRDPANRKFQDAFHSMTTELTSSKNAPEPHALAARYVVAFVPGYAYKMDPTTGGDFARQRALMDKLGFKTTLIETADTGTVEENAAILARTILEFRSSGQEIILVSASKGGPEVALTLGQLLTHEESAHVRAWISVGGVLRGSPIADHLLRWPQRWIVTILGSLLGHPRGIARNLGTEVRGAIFEKLTLPPNLLTLLYVGAPLCSQIERASRGRYKTLRPLGPNDGITLLSDELVEGGTVVTDIGLDHYYRAPDIDLKTLALAQIVMSELEAR